MMGIQPNLLNQLVSVLLGASVAGVLIFFLSSEGVVSPPSTAVILISSWTNGTMGFTDTPAQDANQTSKVDVASPQEANNTAQVSEILITKLLYLFAQSVVCNCNSVFLLPRQVVKELEPLIVPSIDV
jgi:hypothetical protein